MSSLQGNWLEPVARRSWLRECPADVKVPPLELRTWRVEQATVVTVAGELDLATAAQLRHTLISLLDDGCEHLVLACAGLKFCDAAGLGTLVFALNRVMARGGWLRLADPHPSLRRLLTLTDLSRVLPVYPDVTTAVAGRHHDALPHDTSRPE